MGSISALFAAFEDLTVEMTRGTSYNVFCPFIVDFMVRSSETGKRRVPYGSVSYTHLVDEYIIVTLLQLDQGVPQTVFPQMCIRDRPRTLPLLMNSLNSLQNFFIVESLLY